MTDPDDEPEVEEEQTQESGSLMQSLKERVSGRGSKKTSEILPDVNGDGYVDDEENACIWNSMVKNLKIKTQCVILNARCLVCTWRHAVISFCCGCCLTCRLR